jgi:hypothetical protein
MVQILLRGHIHRRTRSLTFLFKDIMLKSLSRGSSASIVSGYRLDARRSTFDPRQKRNDFSSSLCIQTGSGAHPASCPMGTGGPFPGGKAILGRDADHAPLLVPRSRMSRSYSSSPPSASVACSGTALA